MEELKAALKAALEAEAAAKAALVSHDDERGVLQSAVYRTSDTVLAVEHALESNPLPILCRIRVDGKKVKVVKIY